MKRPHLTDEQKLQRIRELLQERGFDLSTTTPEELEKYLTAAGVPKAPLHYYARLLRGK